MGSGSDKQPFLDRLAIDIGQKAAQKPVLVVLPNKRSLFILKEKMEAQGLDERKVQLRTVDELMESVSGVQLMEPEELLITFFKVYSKLEMQPQTFDQFTNWATTFLSDINDVDLHLGNVDDLFHHIDDYHATGEWLSHGEAGPIERNFLSFWKRLPRYYHALREALVNARLGYRGLIYRVVADMATENSTALRSAFAGSNTCWVGVIPGNPSEQALLQWIGKQAKLEVYADTDRYYLQRGIHEAGRLFRTADAEIPAKWTVNLLSTSAYQIKVHPVAGSVAQMLEARSIVESIPKAEWPNTVIAMADPRLISPLMEVFHDLRSQMNITSGYPLRNTLVHRFVMSWVQLHAGAVDRNGDKLFYHQHLEELMEYPAIKTWLQGYSIWARLRGEIIRNNMKFVSRQWLRTQLEGDMFSMEAYALLFDWPSDLPSIFTLIQRVLNDWGKSVQKLGLERVERVALPVYREKLEVLLQQFSELLDGTDLKTLRKFLHRQVGYAKLYIEEPNNDGLQVMGMLETRMVDFKHVIVVGAADDTLPGNPAKATHIPFIHRIQFGLPTKKDTEALITYHFYRLLQRSERVHLIYNTAAEALSGGEPSRFILQLEQELVHYNAKAKIDYTRTGFRLDADDQRDLIVEKTPAVIESVRKFLASRVSPSALNTFINSPLEFYYYYVLKLKEQQHVEEEVEMSTFGSVVHDVLEWVYQPFRSKSVALDKLQELAAQVDYQIEDQFAQRFPTENLGRGRNLIMVELAKRFVQGFIRLDVEEMKKNGPVRILGLEERQLGKINVQGIDINIFGVADRIDERDGVIRIIDYKTGLVRPPDLKCDWDQITADSKYAKAFQLAFYKWAYCKDHAIEEGKVEPMIFSFRSQAEGYMPLVMGSSDQSFVGTFEGRLKDLVISMLDDMEPFAHRLDSKYTTF